MLRRTIGVLLSLTGIVAMVIAALMLGAENPMAPSGSTGDAEAQQWVWHWRWWALATLATGIAIVIAGCGVFLRKPWGLLLVLIVALVLSVTPWILGGIGWLRFAYEEPTLWESGVFGAVGLAALIGLLRTPRGDIRT
jgi:magnesium-transporting ATPase (P-type)